MNNNPIYLDSYTVQADSRIRLPKSAIENLHIEPGKTRIIFYLDSENHELKLKIADNCEEKRDGRQD